MVLAAFLSVALLVGAVGAWHLLRERAERGGADDVLDGDVDGRLIVAPVADRDRRPAGLNTLQYQPAKIAAMEGTGEDSRTGAPLILFGLPDMAEREAPLRDRDAAPGQPDPDPQERRGEGAEAFPPQDRPYSPVVFWAFRIMVGLGF